MTELSIRISRVPGTGTDVPLPAYETEGAAGMDIRAVVNEPVIIPPGETRLVPAGFRVEIPAGYEGQVRPRSGLAIREGIGILNSPGTIDSDYRGEVKVILSNFGASPFTVRRGERIAQLVITPVTRARWIESEDVGQTARGSGGFGHTGQ